MLWASAAGLVAAFAFAWPAKASASYFATCNVEGTAAARVNVVGGSGTYAFTELTAPCAVQGSRGEIATATLDIASSGTFSNVLCGTGSADSTTTNVAATILSSTPAGDPEGLAGQIVSSNLNYHIDFTAGTGSLIWTNQPRGGVVLIQPDLAQPGDPLSGVCTNGFKVEGLVTIGSPTVNPPPVNPGPVNGQGTPPATYPSQACQGTGWSTIGTPINVGSGNQTGGSGDLVHGWLYLSQPPGSPSKVDVCARVQAGDSANAGGRLEVDTNGSPGVTLVGPTLGSDMTGCTLPGPHSDDGTTWRIDTSPVGANPASVCVTVQGSTTRVTVGTSSSASSPIVHWYPDPGTPVPDTHVP